MSNNESASVRTFSSSDCELIAQGLNALLRERSLAYEVSAQVAKTKQQRLPDVIDFKIPDILRLTRLMWADPAIEASVERS